MEKKINQRIATSSEKQLFIEYAIRIFKKDSAKTDFKIFSEEDCEEFRKDYENFIFITTEIGINKMISIINVEPIKDDDIVALFYNHNILCCNNKFVIGLDNAELIPYGIPTKEYIGESDLFYITDLFL